MPITDTADHNGPAIRDFRRIRGLSCADLAEKVGIHEQTLRNIELYDSVTRPENPKGVSEGLLEKIATQLGIRVLSISRGPARAARQTEEAA